MTWEHIVYLSDGTVLTQDQWDALVRDGHIEKLGGGFIKVDPEKLRREDLYVRDTIAGFKEK